MALIRSEISKYKDIVLAIDREIHGHGKKEITWDSFTDMDHRYSPHSVIVGKASDELKQMGFMPTFTYDKEHLQNAMFPEDGPAAHAHGLTADELLRLPHLLNNPVAIVTERNDKVKEPGQENYRNLQFIFAIKDEGEQKYYRAFVQPHAHHNGLLASGYASKVISFHPMDSMRFESIMDGVLDGRRQLLYFDSEKYLAIDSPTKPVELCDYSSVAAPIKGHFSHDTDLRKTTQVHQLAVQRAATAEMNKLILGKGTRGEAFPIFSSSMNALTRGNSIDTLRSAYNTVKKVATLTQDRVLRMRVQEHADRTFARSYVKVMTPELQQSYIDKAVKRINSMSVNSQTDLTNVCNEIERLVSAVPTLQNLGINFSDRVANVDIIMDARQLSGQFQEKLENALADILRDKNDRLQQIQHERDGEELVIGLEHA